MGIDAVDLAVGVPRLLRIGAVRVVPDRDVEKAVRAELQLTTVVVRRTVTEGPHRSAAGRVGDVGIRADVVLVDVDGALRTSRVEPVARVVDVEEAVARV